MSDNRVATGRKRRWIVGFCIFIAPRVFMIMSFEKSLPSSEKQTLETTNPLDKPERGDAANAVGR